MPTARPSIRASVVVTDASAKKWDATAIVLRPMPMPRNAVSSGSPAATMEPRVRNRTMAAMITPIASVAPGCGSSWRALPPISTVSPAARPASARASSASRASGVMPPAPTL